MKQFFYSPSQNAFYSEAVHGSGMPNDVIPVSEVEHQALMVAQANGQKIGPDASGKPVAAAPALSGDEQIELTRRQRMKAYQEEADPLYFKAQRGEATMDEWLAKIEEIKARFPAV